MRKPYKGREYVSPYRMEMGSRVVEGMVGKGGGKVMKKGSKGEEFEGDSS